MLCKQRWPASLRARRIPAGRSLARLSASLTAEVRERQASEEKLQKLVQSITEEKGDLEILVQILIDQGDDSATDAEEAHIDGLTPALANRRRFDAYLLTVCSGLPRRIAMQQTLSLLICDVDHFKLSAMIFVAGHPSRRRMP